MKPGGKFTARIKRQDGPDSGAYWEEFAVTYRLGMNVIILLQDIQKHPVTKSGKKTTPVAWECSCLEEVCGACSMIINGVARQACSTLVECLEWPVTIEPFTKFPLVRDLVVDRSSLFANFKKVRAWIPVDLNYNAGPGPRISQEQQQAAYPLSRCITCGCCLEACPQVNPRSPFMGAAVLNQATLLDSHPTGHMDRHERLSAVRGKGGLADCGNAQNCARVCPKDIPLVDSIARLNREAIIEGIVWWLRK
jgi:succinate dehydrogenase / fumarate reductase, iron-sulfur subunit